MNIECNPFSKLERRKVFRETTEALRDMFPDAKDSFIRSSAWSKARNTPIKKVERKPCARVSVAHTYLAPTRAERQKAHKAKMRRKERTNKWRRK